MPKEPKKLPNSETPKEKRSHKAKDTSVGWTFTYYSDAHPLFDPRKLRCMVYQREVCPTTGNHHWQGALRTVDHHGMGRKSIVKFFPNGIHDKALKKSKGTWEQNFNYATKKETRLDPDALPFILGNPPKFGSALAAAKINHYALIVDDVANKVPLATILRDHPAALQIIHQVQTAQDILHTQDLMIRKPEEFDVPLLNLRDDIVYVFLGPTLMGKTSYALAHFKNPLFVRHLDALKRFQPGVHDGIVFDEMYFKDKDVDFQKVITDIEQPVEISGTRYRCPIIPRGTKRIFCCNTYPFLKDNSTDGAAITRRIELVEFKTPVYTKK